MLRQQNPDCLCIVETKIDLAKEVLNMLGYLNSLEVPARGLKGGMILAWRLGVDFDLIFKNDNIISIILKRDRSYQD